MTRFYPRRLLKLANLLIANARNKNGMKFDMGVIGQRAGRATRLDWKPGLSCGTVGCAMGLAALSGAFKRNGLHVRDDNFVGDVMEVDIRVDDGLVRGFDESACELFGVTEDEVSFLFTPDGYRTALRGAEGERVVAKRIRMFVKDRRIAERRPGNSDLIYKQPPFANRNAGY